MEIENVISVLNGFCGCIAGNIYNLMKDWSLAGQKIAGVLFVGAFQIDAFQIAKIPVGASEGLRGNRKKRSSILLIKTFDRC